MDLANDSGGGPENEIQQQVGDYDCCFVDFVDFVDSVSTIVLSKTLTIMNMVCMVRMQGTAPVQVY